MHNLSSVALSQPELNLLNKGLSFAPTSRAPINSQQLQFLQCFKVYTKSLRRAYIRAQYYRTLPAQSEPVTQPTISEKVYRVMKFLPVPTYSSFSDTYSGYGRVESYIENTRTELDDKIGEVFSNKKKNITESETAALKNLKQLQSQLTIKPADKNLGIVILDTNDYISQCTQILENTRVYKRIKEYPLETIKNNIKEVLHKFSLSINKYDKQLWKFLYPDKQNFQIPKFYGVPKIHKEFSRVPPLRPIVANCNSVLTPIARFLDHVLQPIAQAYPDYLHNTTVLSNVLKDLQLPQNIILVTIDVESLYPSIPQSECL